jgi:predicted Fe-S protein YdhL (DUF1289 family)/8-oxo-dGTP pyrophosphatase MutT (NUDIX family)
VSTFSFRASKPVLSPCVGVCVLDANGLCEGCHRSGDEIAGWTAYSDAQRMHLMNEVLPQRMNDASSATAKIFPLTQRLQHAVRSLDDPPHAPGWNHAELHDLLETQEFTPAAVLVPIVTHTSGLTVLLTRRTEHLTQHAGQVSFPGGRMEPSDVDAIATAVRETSEEVGIAGASIRPFGYLDSFETISSYCVTPVVAWVDAAYRAQPDPREVAQVFEVPLEFFLDAKNLRRTVVNFRGRPREIFEFAHSGQRIWGATAAMLLNLLRRMESVS